jgi:hypothetical protein
MGNQKKNAISKNASYVPEGAEKLEIRVEDKIKNKYC